MVFRKPYAFLIKHFKLINLILLLLIVFSLNRVLNLYSFTKEYVQTGVYSQTLIPISTYISSNFYLSLIFILLFAIILTYLLRRKDKPFITYIYVIILALATLFLSLYISNYFNYNVVNRGYNGQMARLIRDLVFINSLFFYPLIVVLVIRSLGIDLNSFGFYDDKEFISSSEEDREEVEVEVKFDKYKYIRLFKNKYRNIKYFVLEHLYSIIPILFVVIGIAIYSSYHYIFVQNRVFKQGETLTSNYYKITINNSYLTDKDYAGNVISSKSRYFIVIDTSIMNMANDRSFDINKLVLYIDDKYYIPTTRYNKSFQDLGNTYYKGDTIERGKNKNYMFVYEVDKPSEKANFLLKYQDIYSKDKKQIRIKLKVLDISSFKERDKSLLGEELKVPLNNNLFYEFSLSDLSISDSKSYTYESCYMYNCPIYEDTTYASKNKKILYFRVNSDSNINDFITFLTKYAKIKYVKEDKEYIENISLKIKKYRGNYAYLEVSNNIDAASNIVLVFTIRTNQYFYILRGDK